VLIVETCFASRLTAAVTGIPGLGLPAVGRHFAGAFVTAVAGAQEYFHTVIATTPRALASFHARNSYPEHLATFPNPRLTQEPERAPSDP
jgi:hypothetical protein